MDTELENICRTLAAENITVELRRFTEGWRCSLYCRESRLYSTPTGHGPTAIEAVNRARDERIELLKRDGS